MNLQLQIAYIWPYSGMKLLIFFIQFWLQLYNGSQPFGNFGARTIGHFPDERSRSETLPSSFVLHNVAPVLVGTAYMIPIVYSSSAPAIKMADWLSLFSALIIVGCFLLLARFIVSLGVMEREAMFNLNLPRREIPSKQMIEVKNPFVLKLKSLHSTSTADSGKR